MNRKLYYLICLLVLSIFIVDSAETNEENILNEDNSKLDSNQQQEQNNMTSSSIIFLEKLNKCPMYSTICSFPVLINKSINIEKIKFESSDLVVFKNVTIKLCESNDIEQILNETNVERSCPSLAEFKSVNEENHKDYLVYIIYFLPDLVGVADLMININDTEIKEEFNYTIITVQPKRVIDLVFDIYVWSFSLLISTLMGILIDRDALRDIIKMPIPVIIGFVCQYICMPLVNKLCNFLQ